MFLLKKVYFRDSKKEELLEDSIQFFVKMVKYSHLQFIYHRMSYIELLELKQSEKSEKFDVDSHLLILSYELVNQL